VIFEEIKTRHRALLQIQPKRAQSIRGLVTVQMYLESAKSKNRVQHYGGYEQAIQRLLNRSCRSGWLSFLVLHLTSVFFDSLFEGSILFLEFIYSKFETYDLLSKLFYSGG
jgi:hypothetical protein